MSTNYLGHVIVNNGIKPDENKVKTINAMKIPTTVKGIKQFLGITGFYRKFIKDYARVACPMIKYLKKSKKVNVSDSDYVKSFNTLKTLLTSDPILTSPDFSKPFVLSTDASNFALGAVLSQGNHPVCYASRTLNDHERNYSTIEKELLAVVWSVKYFRTYLYGRKFTVRTDHKPLVWLHSLKEPNMKLQRWKIMLNEYDFNVEYLRGKENIVADGLSRLHVNSISNDDDEVSLKEIFNNEVGGESSNNDDGIASTSRPREQNDEVLSTGATVHSAAEDDYNHIFITEKPVNLYKNQTYLSYGTKEKITLKIVHKKIQNHVVIDQKNENLLRLLKMILISKGLMCIYCEDISLFIKLQDLYVKYFSMNKSLKLLKSSIKLKDIIEKNEMLEIIQQEHEQKNHRGISEIFSELKKHYFYPNLQTEIQKFINNCEICNLAKYDRHPLEIPMQVTETPKQFNDIIHIDIWFPVRKRMYLTTLDKFSKYATIHKLEDRNWIAILTAIKERIKFLGKPKKLVSDNETCILHSAVEQFLREHKISFHKTTGSLKTGNADIERLHGTLNEYLRIMNVARNTSDLDDKLFSIINTYNNTIHSTTKLKPIDFIEKNLTQEEIQSLAQRFKQEKEERIFRKNKNKGENFKQCNDLVRNRTIAKCEPKYKRLGKYEVQGNYVVDKSTNRNTKYYKKQLKRQYKYQNTDV